MHLLRVIKNRATLVEQVIDAEFDPRLYGPPEGPVVVVRHVVHEERIVGSQLKNWLGVQTPLVHITRLKREPDLLERHRLGLKHKKSVDRLYLSRLDIETYLGWVQNRQTVETPYQEESLLRRQL